MADLSDSGADAVNDHLTSTDNGFRSATSTSTVMPVAVAQRLSVRRGCGKHAIKYKTGVSAALGSQEVHKNLPLGWLPTFVCEGAGVRGPQHYLLTP